MKIDKRLLLYVSLGFVLGMFFGAMLVYKVEIDTLNRALESLKYCYETYALGDLKQIKMKKKINFNKEFELIGAFIGILILLHLIEIGLLIYLILK